jgi:hypothetical protein
MTTHQNSSSRVILPLALFVAAALALAACGGGSSSSSTGDGAAELAHQHELAQARRQGAQAARQAARIKDLEREVHAVREGEKRKATQSGQSAAEPEPAPAVQTEPGSDDWPGGSGYTAILASVSSEGEARSIQTEATGKGLDAGVLYSSDYSSLRPGYWVVFSGVFPDADGAEGRAGHAHELGYSDAYPRFVSP